MTRLCNTFLRFLHEKEFAGKPPEHVGISHDDGNIVQTN